jgi:hypothetical protein
LHFWDEFELELLDEFELESPTVTLEGRGEVPMRRG